MLIKDLKPISEKLYRAALDNQEAQGNYPDDRASLKYGFKSFVWQNSPQGADFWRAILFEEFDTARRIDKEKGWGLFDPVGDGVADDTEAVKETREFQPGDRVVAICDSKNGHYKKGDEFTFVSYSHVGGEQYLHTEGRAFIFKTKNFMLAEDAPEYGVIDPKDFGAIPDDRVKSASDHVADASHYITISPRRSGKSWFQELWGSGRAKQIKPTWFDWDPAEGVNKSAINDGLPSDYVPPQAPRKAISYLYNDKQREEAERIDRARKRARFT